MNRNARLGIVLAPTTPLWTGKVTSYDAETCTLTVSTTLYSLQTWHAGLVLVHAGAEMIRIRSVDTGAGTIKLSENPASFVSNDLLAIYQARYPWPRYQRITGGVVYKDWDIGFPGTWQAHLPPTANCVVRLSGGVWAEAVMCNALESFEASAASSAANIATGTPLSYAWDAGTGGAVTGSGATVAVQYSTLGFRYLKLTVTDAHGTVALRYIPVWVGESPFTKISNVDANYQDGKGWEVSFSSEIAFEYLRYSPVALVDIDTREVLFVGYLVADQRGDSFDRSKTSYKILPALKFSDYLHTYPLLINNITGVTTPADWSQVYDLTLARAAWFMLYWHSTIPEIANITLETGRDIAGQDFPAGNMTAQIENIAKSAFYGLRGGRTGWIYMATLDLYRDSSAWAAQSATTLSSSAVADEIQIENPQPDMSEAMLDGVYRGTGGNFSPARVRAPSHPEPWGSQAQINGLAPISEAEILLWAGRHIGIANYSKKYTFLPLDAVVDPATTKLVDLYTKDGTVRVAIESSQLQFDAEKLRWKHSVIGRSYGSTSPAVVIPPPPPVVIPTPSIPPITPPIRPIPPRPSWPLEGYVPTNLLGVYKTTNFVDPTSLSQPTWTAINDGLLSTKIRQLDYDPTRNYLYCITEDERTVYVRSTISGSWSPALTQAQARTAIGAGAGTLYWVTVDQSTGSVYAYFSGGIYDVGQYLFKSVDYGANWTVKKILDYGALYGAGALFVYGSTMWRTWNQGGGLIAYSSDGGDNWSVSSSLGFSAWTPWMSVSALSLSQALVAGNGYGGPDLVRISAPGMTATILQDSKNLGIQHPDALAISSSSWSAQRIMSSSKIFRTIDGWSSLVSASPATLSPAMTHLLTPVSGYPDWMITGRDSGLTSGSPHIIFTVNGDGGTPVGRAGNSPGSAPYTGSIPYTCGGAAYGIKFKPR
jgi:hypothetical protein